MTSDDGPRATDDRPRTMDRGRQTTGRGPTGDVDASSRRPSPVVRRPSSPRPRPAIVFPVLAVVLVAAMALAAAQGQIPIAPATVVKILLNRLGVSHYAPSWPKQDETILLVIRLPRVAAAALVGAALATAGALFQGLLRNPLADPYVVGTSGGAAIGAVIAIVAGAGVTLAGFGAVPLAAFLGALASTALVYQLARIGGRVPVVSVLLAGFAVSTLLGYSVSLLLFVNDRGQLHLQRIYGWLLGGIDVTGWAQLGLVGPLIVGTGVAASGLSRSLNALSLGEDGAARLGIAVDQQKRLILVAGSLLTAAAVSISGLVGFVGLVVPHSVRLACGPDHRTLLPAAAIGGAIFLVLADLLARALIPPAELPVGVVTAFLGGPFFLWLLRRTRREYVW